MRPGKKGEKEHADLGYESEQTFVVEVPDAKTTTVAFTADDDGDLPEYEPEIEHGAEVRKMIALLVALLSSPDVARREAGRRVDAGGLSPPPSSAGPATPEMTPWRAT